MAFAHSLKDAPREQWHSLELHLRDTAAGAAQFARSYGESWAFLAGLWHDVGKYAPEFQRMTGADPDAHCESHGRVDHSTAGALLATRQPAGLPLAFAVAGHHAGLPDLENLRGRLQEKNGLLENARKGGLPTEIENQPLPASTPAWCTTRLQVELWIRFVYSALVDADFLDTERFYTKEERNRSPISLLDLQYRLDARLERMAALAARSPVNEMRARVLKSCRDASEREPGNFSLTAPTGGGKTLASMAFALRHALRHGLQHVLVVIPFTSIIEQSASRYREVFGEDAVIEHHSNLDPERETARNRLASENWDAPIIVTTSVQFLESLFSNRSSRCRKLHNIAESVVVFDEVQTLPPKLLSPILDVLTELGAHYRVSQLFCTATQPALHARADMIPPRPGIPSLREIMDDPAREFEAVRDRYIVDLPAVTAAPTQWDKLAQDILSHPRILVVVNSREDAATLAELLGEECLHLSARMCAAHRKDVLEGVRVLLESGGPCRVVSTQLIEAGVDVDFPVVFRAMAGADSLAQAAGRCNREGLLPQPGLFRVFVPPRQPPAGILRLGKQETEMLWRAGRLDLMRPETFTRYFQGFYAKCDTDAKGVNQSREALRFEQTARLFQMIEEAGQPIVAPYGDAPARLDRLRREGATRQNLRALQPFLVNLYQQDIQQLATGHSIERVEDVVWATVTGYEHLYDERFGFRWRGQLAADAASLIA